MKRTGGATVSTIVMWHVTSVFSSAEHGKVAGSVAGSDCPSKTTKTNRGSLIQRKTVKWTRHTNQNGSVFWLRTEDPIVPSGGSPSPGNFPDRLEFIKNGKTCQYVKAAKEPAEPEPIKGNWAKISGVEQNVNAGDSLPNPPEDWVAEPSVTTSAVYQRTITWEATQEYILQ